MLKEWSFFFNQEVDLKYHSDSNKMYKWFITFCPFYGKIHGFRLFFCQWSPIIVAVNFASLAKYVSLTVSVSWAMIFTCGYQI